MPGGLKPSKNQKTKSMVIMIALSCLLSACAQNSGQRNRVAPFFKSPSNILALDIAQNRKAQDEGAYIALLETAADNAITFVPNPVDAKIWLEKQPPIQDTAWQPHQVIMSCDGKTGVTTGAIKWGDVDGYYTTVWQYTQTSKKGEEWRWLLSHGDKIKSPRNAPEFLRTQSASCKGKPGAPIIAPQEDVQMKQGFSRDQSLSWSWQYHPNGGRSLSVNFWDGMSWQNAFTDIVTSLSGRVE